MQRYEAKKAKNFAEADRIEIELKAQGIEIVDTKDGASWRRVYKRIEKRRMSHMNRPPILC